MTNYFITVKPFFIYLGKQKHIVAVSLVTWVVATYFLIQPLRCIENLSEIATLREKLNQESLLVETLKHHNKILLTKTKQPEVEFIDVDGSGPTPEYENLRRRIHSNTKELWYYLSNQLEKATSENLTLHKIRHILKEAVDRKRSLLSDQEKLPGLDGHEEWRRQEAANVGDLVQRRLIHLQNPSNCRTARKLICNLNKSGGFGCQIHHLVYCLILAYATERTVILESKGWQYNYSGWESHFHPLSDSCTNAYNDTVLPWPASATAKVVSVPILEKIYPKPMYLPPVIPQDLADRIAKFNGDASSWWVGQIVKYILKPLHSIQEVINDTVAKVDVQSPIVGIHVRRTDKVKESKLYDLKEYMIHVAHYYAQLELTTSIDVRRVYIATDEASVLEQAQRDYPQYSFYSNTSIAMSAAVERRTTGKALTGLLVDLHILSKCHYVVCTFSSNFGRMAYELMQTNRVDASPSILSLDDNYYFCLIFALDRIAVIHNKDGDADISFEAGHQLALIPKHYRDGYYRGANKNTLTSGLIAWYKTAEHLMTYPFPEYKQVPTVNTIIYKKKTSHNNSNNSV